MRNYKDLELGEFYKLYFYPDDMLSELLEKVEREVIRLAIIRCKGNQVMCSEALGISRGTLRTKLKLYFNDGYFKTKTPFYGE